MDDKWDGTPKMMVDIDIRENPLNQWMIGGYTPIFGKHHRLFMDVYGRFIMVYLIQQNMSYWARFHAKMW